eukprot:1448408-Prymnesium_polylepis.1
MSALRDCGTHDAPARARRHARGGDGTRERIGGRACATCARGKGMSWAGPEPLSIGIIWGVGCLAKYWKNIWHLLSESLSQLFCALRG